MLTNIIIIYSSIDRHLGYERVYLPLYQVADTPFHIQGDEICHIAVTFTWNSGVQRETEASPHIYY